MLNTAITCVGFMPNGGVLAFGLQHAYPLTPDHGKVEEFTMTFPKILQGCDRTLYAIVTELGLNVEIHPVFDVEDEGDEMLTLVAEEFCPSAVWCMFDEEKWKYDIILEWYNAKQYSNIIWCSKPKQSVVVSTYYDTIYP
ncbi:hypothetical protein BC938DRAFT_472395 [Jimgerdemannia flammicorona]|uniref:Uncharacterized protein n=1 Tax=Jimgerdemannia flammicorona TaxID=994334 RepID=A0A433QU27_9FUNG|nr:hypothetical protein BC938DRAFT_472395 [Jimgerdemannia flammicorona]